MRNEKENIILINKVKKYIEKNIDQKLPLSKLSGKANFSPFHFQRVFKSIVGETPKQYIKRLRLEATSHHIILKPQTSLLEVGLQYGFTSLEAFSRAFKDYYKISPDNFRKSTEENKMSIICKKTKSNGLEEIDTSMFLSTVVDSSSEPLKINIVQTKPKKLVYIAVTLKDIKTVVSGYKRITNWAGARSLVKSSSETFGLMKDFPAFTALDKCRFYTCVSVDIKPEVLGEISYMEIPSRTCATFKVKGRIDELLKSVSVFATQWLPDSGYEINHVPAILIPAENTTTSDLHNVIYDIYIALSPK